MSAQLPPRVITLGETMGLVRVSDPGLLRAGAHARLTIGGAETNVAIALCRLGIGARWMGRVGADGIGDAILATLRAEQVDLVVEIDAERATGLMIKESFSPGSSRVTYYRSGSAASAMSPDMLQPALFAGIELLHLTGITPALSPSCAELACAAAKMAHENGVCVSLDVNYRSTLWGINAAREQLQRLLPFTRILFGGHSELALLYRQASGARPRDDTDLLSSLAAAGPRQVVLKRGAAGAASQCDGEYAEAAALPITPIDTVGAGDAFVAGYLAAMLDGRSPVERLKQANACGGLAVNGG